MMSLGKPSNSNLIQRQRYISTLEHPEVLYIKMKQNSLFDAFINKMLI